MNLSTLTNDETILNTGIVVSTGITKTQSITQNTTITTSYVDGTDSYIIYTTGNSLYYPIIQSLKFFDCNLTAAIASGGTYITSPTSQHPQHIIPYLIHVQIVEQILIMGFLLCLVLLFNNGRFTIWKLV